MPTLRARAMSVIFCAGLRISVQILCPEHSRLLQHYEAALRRWALAEWSSNRDEPNTLLRVSGGIKKKKALDERDAAKEQLNLHKRTCPTWAAWNDHAYRR